MAEYKNEEPCEFIYNITAIEKVVDGDTIDAVIDLGFDVRFCGRIRMLGIDTPESRTRNLEEKFYGKLSSAALKSWVHWAVVSDRDDIEIQLRCPEADSRGKFGRILGEIWINCTELVGAPECGDVMKLQIQVDDKNRIVDAKFKTFGCGSAIASSSLATEWVKGKSIDEASMIQNTEIVKELSLPPVKIHCSVLAEDAIKAAIKDYKSKREMG